MVIFTVHEPPNGPGDRLDRAERLVFVKDGFSWIAALIPPVWLLVKGLWLELAIYMGATGLVVWLLTTAETNTASSAFLVFVQIVFGFEAGAIYSAALERRGWAVVGTVAGRDREDCERRFLEFWLPTYTQIPVSSSDGAAIAAPNPSWVTTAWTRAKDAIESGRRRVGARA